MKKPIAALAILLPLYSFNLCAGNATTTFLVTAFVQPSCAITALPLKFDEYDPTGIDSKYAEKKRATNGTFMYATCVNGTPYSITLNAGLYPSTENDVNTRNMKGGKHGGFLPYRIYPTIQLAGAQWGDGDNGSTVVSAVATGIQQIITAYGVMSPYQTALPTDIYSDTITVSVFY